MCDQQLIKSNLEKSPPDHQNGTKLKNRNCSLLDLERERSSKLKTKILIGSVVALVLVAGFGGYLTGRSYQIEKTVLPPWIVPNSLPDVKEPLPPSSTWLQEFRRAAVCVDAKHCSEVGRRILAMNGSAVDSAIATMFCNGIINQQSVGLGGGFFMTVYIKEENKAYSVIAREKAPAAATQDMFHGDMKKARVGGLAVAVPGDLRGMWAAYKRWGRLPWDMLVKPTLEFCKYGYPLSIIQYQGLVDGSEYIKKDHNLRQRYYDEAKKKFYDPGTIVNPGKALCSTLKIIAERGGDEIYNGTLARDFLEDLERAGSIITAEDLKNYLPKITEPLSVPLSNGDVLFAPPPPSSGAILANILNILKGYNFTSDSINGTGNKILTYHRIIEAFKYALGARTKLADPEFLDMEEYLRKITDPEYGEQIRLKINDTMTSNSTAHYGATEYLKSDSGTAHLCIIAPNGDTVSVTSSINHQFGALFSTLKTGIVMNNIMDDFSSPGITNYYDVEPSPANFIAPGKRPFSSMSPSIIVDKNGDVKMAIGASGGTRIVTSVALVAMRKLWFGQTIKEAQDEARFHHQLLPMYVNYEYGVPEDILEGFRAKGHGVKRYSTYRTSTVCALYRNETGIYGNADCRKGGDVAGID